MNEMIEFSSAILLALADFLATPPVFYLFSLVCACFIVKMLKILISR